jgi:hypothetical protein
MNTESDIHDSSPSDSTTIVIILRPEPTAGLRIEDTTPGWEDLVPDSE